jgi:hypothetical protein
MAVYGTVAGIAKTGCVTAATARFGLCFGNSGMNFTPDFLRGLVALVMAALTVVLIGVAFVAEARPGGFLGV